jgi:hypothetical protein
MPEETFITSNKFYGPQFVITDPPASSTPNRTFTIKPFPLTTAIPFPSEECYDRANPNRQFVRLPHVAFNYLGQLVSGTGDEYIPLARGAILHGRDPRTGAARAAAPTMTENPPGNATNILNLIHIDRLTGRARLIQQELQ